MTLFAELSGALVLEGRVVIPRAGAFHADVVLDGQVSVAASRLVLAVGDLRLTCATWRAPVSFQGRTSVRLIGGAGGWRNVLPARAYRSPTSVRLSLVLGDAAREAGETIVVANDTGLGSHYVRERAPACRHLNALLAGDWWIGPDGVTRAAARDATPIASAYSLVSYDGARGRAVVATESPADFQPGRTFRGPTLDALVAISGVTHTISKGALRTEVLAA